MNISTNLTRDEMRSISAGSMVEPCEIQITCHNGVTIGCANSEGNCHYGNEGTIHGWINCGLGTTVAGCWFHGP